MAISESRSRSIEALAEDYARSRREGAGPVSITAAVRAIRMVAPDMTHTDSDVANIVAAWVVRYGHSVDFDLPRSA